MPSNSDNLTAKIGADPGQLNQSPHPQPLSIATVGVIVFTLPLSIILGVVLRQKFRRWRFKQKVAQLERTWQLTTARRKE